MENGFSMVFQWQTSISDSEGSLISGTLTSALDVLFGNYTCITVVQGMMCECSYNDRFGHFNAPILNRCFGSINFCYSRILLIIEIVAVVLIIANLHVYH